MGGSQILPRDFQRILASRSIFTVDLTLTAVQSCLQESNLIDPVVLVLALLISHAYENNPVHLLDRGRPWFALKSTLSWMHSPCIGQPSRGRHLACQDQRSGLEWPALNP